MSVVGVENILIARKLSVLEYDAQSEGVSLDQAVEKFKRMGVDGERILSSHDRQVQSIQKTLGYLADSGIRFKLVVGDEIPRDLARESDLVVTLGGDNYFQHLSHFIDRQPILGINSDPETSNGVLTHFTADGFKEFLPRLKGGSFDVEKWCRLQTKINGQILPTLSVSEIYLGAYKSTDMSRYILELPESWGTTRVEEQKSSGLIIATEAGETGWYDAAARYTTAHEDRDTTIWWTPGTYKMLGGVHPNSGNRYASFIAREPYVSNPFKGYLYHKGVIYSREKLKITWLAHGRGLVSIDARDEYELTRGDKVEIGISNKPLRVITP